MTNPRNPYFASQGRDSGIGENQFLKASGLRNFAISGLMTNDPQALVEDFNPANVADWTEIPLDRNRLPFPCTPCIRYRQDAAPAPGGQQVSFRLFGFDQFGQPTQSGIITPVGQPLTVLSDVPRGTLTSDDDAVDGSGPGYNLDTYLFSGVVFSIVTRFEYRLANSDAADRIDLGVVWNFDAAEDVSLAAVNFGHVLRLGDTRWDRFETLTAAGIGLPFRLAPSDIWAASAGTPFWTRATPVPSFEIHNFQLEDLTAANNLSANVQPRGTFAAGPGGWMVGTGDNNRTNSTNKIGILALAAGAQAIRCVDDQDPPGVTDLPLTWPTRYRFHIRGHTLAGKDQVTTSAQTYPGLR